MYLTIHLNSAVFSEMAFVQFYLSKNNLLYKSTFCWYSHLDSCEERTSSFLLKVPTMSNQSTLADIQDSKSKVNLLPLSLLSSYLECPINVLFTSKLMT